MLHGNDFSTADAHDNTHQVSVCVCVCVDCWLYSHMLESVYVKYGQGAKNLTFIITDI